MKLKNLTVLLISAAALLISCEKQFTCTCTDAAGDKSKYTVSGYTQRMAEKDCDGYEKESSATVNGSVVNSKSTCNIE
ncbi:MAG: hypothetical protein KJ941_09380 [Bacteroidetes bacterium]|nr:hypothetical protein [Bacteroidota bacterium]